MCGIFMTHQEDSVDAGKKVFSGLKKIEYRGYDSWGVVVLKESGFEIKKVVGKLSDTEKSAFPDSHFSLGHTRWATHGGVTEQNAHPHLAQNQSFVLAQNGVVENFQVLKKELEAKGYVFQTQTDTEVIVGMIEKEMANLSLAEPTPNIIKQVFLKLHGRNTIAVLTKTGKMYAVRNGSPLILGKNKKNGSVYFSSDVASLSGEVDEYVAIESGQMVEFAEKKVAVTDLKSGRILNPKFAKMDVSAMRANKDGHDSFMLKEIHEQASVLSNVIFGKEKKFEEVAGVIAGAKIVFFLGAGTAYYACMHSAHLLRKVGINAIAMSSYEAESFRPLCDKNSVCVVYSQSGETADTNEIVEWMKVAGVMIISAVNMQGSTLTALSDYAFMLDVGPEMAVASTKAFSGQVIWGYAVFELLQKTKFSDLEKNVKTFEKSLYSWLFSEKKHRQIKKIAKFLSKKSSLFILGRGDLYPSSLESALKLKEISYIHAEGFSAGELKHGVIALIDAGTPVLCLVAEDENKANMYSAIAEIKARGGHVIVVASQNNEMFDKWIEIPEMVFPGANLTSLMSVVPSQLLTCYMAMEKSYNVDKPRNLAKSVTVK